MVKDIIYYIRDVDNTHLFRFYEDGTALYLILKGNMLDQKEQVRKKFKENEHYIKTGQFYVDGKKISFDIEVRDYDFHVYRGDILENGELQLTIFLLDSQKGGGLILKPFDTSIQFDWQNSRYNSNTENLLDLRLSTFKQLQQKLGEANVFWVAIEFLDESDSPLKNVLNDFLIAAGNELPNAQLKSENNWSIVVGNNVYELKVDNRASYISNQVILKDLNSLLEAQGSHKRIFHFVDMNDVDANPCYFYADYNFGLQIMELLYNPPFYPYDYKKWNNNRVIEMKYIDSTTEKQVKYFKRLIPDF